MNTAKSLAAIVILGFTLSGPAHAFEYLECSETDVTFGLDGESPSAADDCFDWSSEYGNPTVELGMVEAGFGTESDNDWTYVTKSEGSDATGSYLGVNFTLGADQSGSGGWTLAWNDPNGEILPLDLDLAVVIKAARGTGGFLFEEVEIPVYPNSGGGIFEVGVINGGGPADLSHATLFLREGEGSTPPGGGNEVPVPGTVALMMLAFSGFRLISRKKH